MRTVRAHEPLDCSNCGACCRGQSADGDYVPVTRLDRRRLTSKYVRKLVRLDRVDEHGAKEALPLKRFGEHEACVALKGKMGKDVSCEIYAQRPEFCRTFEKGSAECYARRREIFTVVK